MRRNVWKVMFMTDYERVLDAFFATAQLNHKIPEDLLRKWFDMAVNSFSFDIFPLFFDEETQSITNGSDIILDVLGKMIYLQHLRRERARVNRLHNITGRDLTSNFTETKRALKTEYDDVIYELEQLKYKLKRHAFS